VLTAEEVAKIEGWSRYKDTGGGIPSRTLPGSGGKGAFFTRGSGHNRFGGYTEDSDEYQEVLDRIAEKFRTAAHDVPKAEIALVKDAHAAIITLGSCRGAVQEAITILATQGIACDFMRIRGFPFGGEVLDFLETHERIFVVEQNRDAQMRSMIEIETGTPRDKMIPILDYAGLPITAKGVVNAVATQFAGVPS
jgi:2-oxoglutarate ferredoxin oxidoreductase subunit alpha